MKLLTAREWLCQGGGGHEGGEDGIRAMTVSGERLVELMDAYGAYITYEYQEISNWLAGDNASY